MKAFFAIGAVLAGGIAASAAEAPKVKPPAALAAEDCVAQYFQLCSSSQPQTEASVRACIEKHRSAFHPSCLELAKGFK